MNSPWNVIEELESTSSRLEKESILEREKNNIELSEGFFLALSPFITFGVKKIPSHGGPDGQGLPWAAFKELCYILSKRELTGDAAREAIELALTASTKQQWNNFFRRILIKDLRCGVSEKTINKVKPGAVPLFECMLAQDGTNHESKVSGKKLLEPKLDGVRALLIVDAEAKSATIYSRNGKILENFGHITKGIEDNIELFDRSVVIDGEVVSSSFQALMKQVHRKSDADASDARLMAFDILPFSEFRKGKSTLGQRRRSNLLRSMKAVLDKVGGIDIIPQLEVDLDTAVGEMQFKQYNTDAIDAGFEGIMIKDPDAPYVCKRHVAWLKIKPSLTVDLAVVALEEGTGKNAGKLGALVCEGTDQGKRIQVNVGSGLTDEQRDEIWFDKDNVVGQIVEVKADAVTQNQDKTYSLRFPRFIRFRGFKTGEKI